MICPSCEHPKSEVLETRASGDGIRRRRSCVECGHRFTTHERIDQRLPLIIKKNGTRATFDRDKVYAGLQIACRKRPVSALHLEEATARVEQAVVNMGRSELPATEVGRLVLSELKSMDLVGYLRFASVYQEIQSPDDFLELLRPWVNPEDANRD